MDDQDTPNRSANKNQAERERWSSKQDVVPDSKSHTGLDYEDGTADAGGISHRPLDKEIDNQTSVPDRGRTRTDEPSRNTEGLER